jgi:hypothetical protein
MIGSKSSTHFQYLADWSSIVKALGRGAFVCWLVILGLSGCDAADGTDSVKLDATSHKSSLESLQKMTAGMSDEQKKAFVEAATTVAFRMNEGTQNTASAETFWKGVHGMTKAEIEAKAREIQAKENAAKP